MKKRIFAAILAAAMTFTAAPTLLPAADISVSAAKSEKLPAPKKITITERTDDSVTLLWDSVEGADGYVIYRYNSKTKKYEKLKNLKEKDYSAELYGKKYPAYQTYKIEGLKKGKTYRYKIAALVRGADRKYTVQTKSKAVTAKIVDAPEVSIPPLGMTKTEFFKKYDKNAFALYFFPFNEDHPFGGYEGKALYRGEIVKATVNFDQEGRVRFFSVIREDRKASAIQSECDRLTKKYGEPYTLRDTWAQWFVQIDQDRGMDIGYLFSDRNGKSEDIIYVEYIYEGADEIGKIQKGNAG